ncbi:DPBB_1 domain-containing protein [Meloidogyne graminicola]|uniref:DPBB_1 domain-containing protein n=1 Tax=Meloidogyne graminicola TaxID=189291 RepID=A0A8S9ZDU7_9BILA|nr:DPBB_1 domain-containing protein [Meloidogyne graminicola]
MSIISLYFIFFIFTNSLLTENETRKCKVSITSKNNVQPVFTKLPQNQPIPTQNNDSQLKPPAAGVSLLPRPSENLDKYFQVMRHQGETPIEQVVDHFAGINKYGGNSMVVKQILTQNDTCIKMFNQTGVFDDIMNKPITNGIMTHYKTGDGGACGCDTSDPIMSAAASTELFDQRAPWLESCRPGKPYMNSDRICINKCVKIEYKGKSLTVPITNSCPGCPKNHVDLSIPTFMWLEPNWRLGRIGNITLTFMTCPGME